MNNDNIIIFILILFIIKLNCKINKTKEKFTMQTSMKTSISTLGNLAKNLKSTSSTVVTIPENVIIEGDLEVKKNATFDIDLEVKNNSKLNNWDIRNGAIGIKDRGDLSLFDTEFRLNKYGETDPIGAAANPIHIGVGQFWYKSAQLY